MASKHQAKQYVSMAASETDVEIELVMVVDFTVHPGSAATTIDPAEAPSAEVDNVSFFELKNGTPTTTPVSLMAWMIDRFTEGEDFQDWMLTEAGEQHIAAEDDYADHRREMIREASP